MALVTALAATAQKKAPEGFYVIEEQPEGELRIYNRHGSTRDENRDDNIVTTGKQEGTVNIVFADDRTVYIQRPVSESYYEGWVKGTLSDDGTTITVPTGQYTAYTRSFDMAVQMWMMKYDGEKSTYVADESITEIVYTVGDDGSISLQGTDAEHFLGVVNRCFGDTFSYLDFEWHGFGDFDTVYMPFTEEVITPPAGLQTQTMVATTGCHDGIGWTTMETTVQLGFDGDDVWIQGITPLLPQVWVKGSRSGNTITIPSGQMLGSYYSAILYLVGAQPDENDEPVIADIVFTYDGKGTYTSFTDIFINSSRETINFAVYYMGLTISETPDRTVAAPESLTVEPYIMSYEEPDENGNLVSGEAEVGAAIDGDNVYIQGITPIMPEAFVRGSVNKSGKVEFASPQFLGYYSSEEEGDFPIFFQAYDGDSGELLPSVEFSFDRRNGTLTAPSATIGIGINKTGLLLLQSFYDTALTPQEVVAVDALRLPAPAAAIYNLQGQRVDNGQRSMVNGQSSMVNGQWSMVNGESSMVNGQRSMVNGQSSMVNCQRSMVNGQLKKGLYIVNGKKIIMK